jgi:hypothetical protein
MKTRPTGGVERALAWAGCGASAGAPPSDHSTGIGRSNVGNFTLLRSPATGTISVFAIWSIVSVHIRHFVSNLDGLSALLSWGRFFAAAAH